MLSRVIRPYWKATQMLYCPSNTPLLKPIFSFQGVNTSANSHEQGRAAEDDAQETTHFGYQTVARQEKQKMVHDVFRNVADKYDLMNDAMSTGMHRLWKDCFVEMLEPIVPPNNVPVRVLDLAGGTGDIAFRIAESIRSSPRPNIKEQRDTLPEHEVVICDINSSMLEAGQQRLQNRERLAKSTTPKLSWVEGDAMSLPFDDNSFDIYTIAFGIRNVTDVDAALSEAFRVLKPGGRFLCLEFSQVDIPVLSSLYDLYSFQVIPFLGQMIANDRASYQYLVESIRRFPPQEEFQQMIEQAGFHNVYYKNFTGGVCAVHSGIR
eukprot:gb/GECG01008566.1/.p1 GENE.gb/GECG01008566.1/~~gb/GECG01008566.1/.p1  ORF type:complete len:321 (+),score=41.88 gb/GECG01008566.1/:1-963(+)